MFENDINAVQEKISQVDELLADGVYGHSAKLGESLRDYLGYECGYEKFQFNIFIENTADYSILVFQIADFNATVAKVSVNTGNEYITTWKAVGEIYDDISWEIHQFSFNIAKFLYERKDKVLDDFWEYVKQQRSDKERLVELLSELKHLKEKQYVSQYLDRVILFDIPLNTITRDNIPLRVNAFSLTSADVDTEDLEVFLLMYMPNKTGYHRQYKGRDVMPFTEIYSLLQENSFTVLPK